MNYAKMLRTPSLILFPIHLLIFVIASYVTFVLALALGMIFKSSQIDSIPYFGIIFILPLLFLGFLMLGSLVNFVTYLYRNFKHKDTNILIPYKNFIISYVVLIALAYLLVPKVEKQGTTCMGCEQINCNCAGTSFSDGTIPGTQYCIGIVYQCIKTGGKN